MDKREAQTAGTAAMNDLSRREFVALSVAAGLAGSTGAAAAAPQPVVENDVVVTTPDGRCDAAFIHPASGAHPGVLLWPDAFGLRPSMREMARRLAAEGYAVLVPNPFYRVAKAPQFETGSHFDFQNQAVLYLPAKMPDPRTPQWGAAAAEEVIKIVNATYGRAFVLCTSFAGMNEMFERVASQIDYPCLVQGSAAKGELLKKFRSTPNAVLFATSSFWQGVDVRGEQLSCVIIDKLPFAVPSDPIVAARQHHIEDQGGSSFYEYSVPQAIISLKQGLGRLIRSTSDRGVLAVLDPRLRTKMYGRTFLQSLPPCRVTSQISDLATVFEAGKAATL